MQKWIRNLKFEDYLKTLKIGLKLDRQTKIASIGSCFAREIREYLLKNGYNYLLVEQDKNPWLKIDKQFRPNQHGSAAWDRVFNTFTLKYIIWISFGDKSPHLHKAKDYVADLIRTRVAYSDLETAKVDNKDHAVQSAKVFKKADVLIVTLGLTEVWSYGGMMLPYLPEYIAQEKLKFHKTSYWENLENLRVSWNVLKEHNPKLRMLLTLSPIHMNATFREDIDVFSASCASKSILRAVIDTFVSENEGVFYFPSYEITTILCQELGIKPYRDGHHISKEAFSLITQTFEELLC